MKDKNNLFKLSGKVQHYQWGGSSFLPALLHYPVNDGKPFAEYWLGAHNNFPSEMKGQEVPLLDKYISVNPFVLGKPVERQFGRLPYLLKVLDVKDMLSIQVHPSKDAAVLEFTKESSSGIALTDARRNYKDDNHKPELMYALSDFWLLHGFKPEDDLIKSIKSVPEFDFMCSLFEEGGYETLYRKIMEAGQERVNEILQPVLQRIIPEYQEGKLQKGDASFWAARAALTYNQQGNADRGIFSVYLLNLVNLRAGEAIFQDAGILHAYLEGQNMEIMANSDNVLRGGLTPKHIDVNELMKHVKFDAVHPIVIRGTKINEFEEAYLTPARDFQLNKLSIPAGRTAIIHAETTEIYFVYSGVVEMSEKDAQAIEAVQGEAAVAFAGASVEAKALQESVIFRATVPLQAGE